MTELSLEVINALEIVWDDYFPPGMKRTEAIENFRKSLIYNRVGFTLSDIFRQKLLDGELLTADEQKAYAVLFKEEAKYPDPMLC